MCIVTVIILAKILKISKMVEEGGMYVHYTKYGGVNTGTVKTIGYSQCYDTENKLTYFKHHLVNEKGIRLELDGSDGQIFPIASFLSDEQCEDFKKLAEHLGNRKAEIHCDIEEKINSGLFKFPS